MAKTQSDVPAIAGLTFPQLQACLTAGATFEQIRELAEGGFGFEQIKELAPSLGAARSASGGLTADQLKDIITNTSVSTRKALKPENERHPGHSVFNYPEGDVARPKPRFVRDVFFNDSREQWDQLTPLEVELYNRFDTNRQAREGMWRAEIRRNGSAEELRITTEPRTLDGRMSLPPLTQILRELLDGEEAANPDKLAEQVLALRKQIEALTAASRQPAVA